MNQLKVVKSHYLYNMLQDFRHIVVFDLRKQSQFNENQIRDAFNLDDNITAQKIREVIELSIKKGQEKEKKYPQLKKIRRFFFVDESSIDPKNLSPVIKQKIQLVLSVIPKDTDNKFYALGEGYKQYYQQYFYTCLVKAEFDKLRQKNATQQQLQKLLLYPYCRFPTEIIPGKLFLGNIFSSNSEKQLKDLKIKSLVDFVDYKAGEQNSMETLIPNFKHDESKYSFLQLPFNKDVSVNINFDVINEEIDKRVTQGTTLLYCQDGETISAAFAIAYLMYKANLDVSMATLKVCQAISRTDITKWIYTQLLVYKPKKQTTQSQNN